MKRYQFILRPLTAVHIGTGEAVSPLEYALFSSKSGERLFAVFSPEKIVESLSEAGIKQFSTLCSSNKFIELRQFLSEMAKMPSFLYVCSVSQQFESEFDKRKDDSNNALEVDTIYRSVNYAPVIPGSSIKGALRTALLNRRAGMIAGSALEDAAIEATRSRFDKKFQSKAMPFFSPNDDPMRALAVGDCTFSRKGTQLVGNMVMYHLSSAYPDPFSNKAALFAEILKGELITEYPIESSSDVIIHDELSSAIIPQNSRALEKRIGQKLYTEPISIDEVIDACDTFYNRVFNSEYNKIIKSSDELVKRGADALAHRIDKMQEKGEYLIRIGRWSHIEAVTVEGYRKPKTSKGYGKTRTLLEFNDNYYLMGWCAFSIKKVD